MVNYFHFQRRPAAVAAAVGAAVAQSDEGSYDQNEVNGEEGGGKIDRLNSFGSFKF